MAVNGYIDKCAYFTISSNGIYDEMVLYSGILNCESGVGWEWCRVRLGVGQFEIVGNGEKVGKFRNQKIEVLLKYRRLF